MRAAGRKAVLADLAAHVRFAYSALRPMFGLSYSAEDEAFRSELIGWLAAHLPRTSPPEDEEERRRFQRAWQRDLAAGGWVGIQWPREYGGRDATLKQQIVFTEEMARARAPEILDAVSVNIVGPTLIRFGTREQKARWLPPIRPAHEVWCLGFSEPNAGSDLASLRCRAVRDGDHWVVSGQKVWSSKAHFADWCLLLVRTDPDVPKHRGITCLIVDMTSPGIRWRPLVQISGRSEFNELFLDEVRVPADNVLGPVNGGWPLIRAALAHERGTLWAFDFKVRLQNGCLALADLYRRCRETGRGDVATFRDRVAQAWIEAQIFGAHTLRILPRLHDGGPDAPTDAALQKLFGSEIQQRTLELATAIAGSYAQLAHDPRALDGGTWAEAYLYSRSVTISSGTSEVLRNVIAQQALGLPRGT